MKYKTGDQIESYRLLQECGSGAYGTVFLAESVLTGQRFALKIIFENTRFSQRELRGISQYMQICPHTALMQIYHAGNCGDSFYYVMDAADALNADPDAEYIPDTLENRMKHHDRIPPQTLLKIAEQCEERLRFLHRSGLLHRDIKPGNILFLNGEAVPGDIGLLTEEPGSTLAGTPGFLAPEVLSGLRPFSPQDDFYALGKTLYCALTGYPPEKYPAFPPELSLKECKDVIALYNRWCAGECEVVPEKKQAKVTPLRAGIVLAAALMIAAGILVYLKSDMRTEQTSIQVPVSKSKNFCSIQDALKSVESMIAAHKHPPGFIELRSKLEDERTRLWKLRIRHAREAYDAPVSKEELEQAARDPNCGIYNAETYVRIKRKDKATAAFDRAHKDDPVISYFETAEWISNILTQLRAMAPMAQQLSMTDFSTDRALFSEACAKLTELEHTLMRIYGPASGKKTREN